jgi:histidine ammonia-lyase
MLCAAQALDFRISGRPRPPARKPGVGTLAAYQALRAGGIAPLTRDRVLAPDIERAAELVHSGQIAGAVEAALDIAKEA